VYVSPRRNICTALPGAAFFAMAMNSSNEVIFVLCHHSGGSPAGGPTPPIKGRFHRRSDEFLESIKKGVETPEKGRNAGEKLIPQGQAGGGGIKNQRINPVH